MPNWCDCDLLFLGTEQECRAFVDRWEGVDAGGDPAFDFRRAECDEGSPIGFRLVWHIDPEYGDVYALRASFQTKWAPPERWFHWLVRQMDHGFVRLNYFERGMEFCGELSRDEATGKVTAWMIEDYKGVRGG